MGIAIPGDGMEKSDLGSSVKSLKSFGIPGKESVMSMDK